MPTDLFGEVVVPKSKPWLIETDGDTVVIKEQFGGVDGPDGQVLLKPLIFERFRLDADQSDEFIAEMMKAREKCQKSSE